MKGVGRLAGANPAPSDLLPFTPSKLVHNGHKETRTRRDGQSGGWHCQPANPQRTEHFTASTCRQCGHIVLAGTIYGLHLDLEPTTLDDQGEYLALRDGVPTYDLWPDRTARRRHLEEIAHPERVPRHARHTCGSQYGQHPRPTPPPHAALDPDAPAPF